MRTSKSRNYILTIIKTFQIIEGLVAYARSEEKNIDLSKYYSPCNICRELAREYKKAKV